MPDPAERSVEAVRTYLQSLASVQVPAPCPEAVVAEPSLQAIYTPVAAFRQNGETLVLFMTGEYDFDDARLLAVIARYKALILPRCRAVFINRPAVGPAVAWLGEPTLAAALVSAVYHAECSPSTDPALVTRSLLEAVAKLFGFTPARMGEGLAQLDQALATELFPRWTLAAEGKGLIRPLVRALNQVLRQALDEVLPPAAEVAAAPRLAERVRIWKQGKLWYQFQGLEYVEGMFTRREAGLHQAYQGLYQLNRNPDAPVDRVRLRVLTAPPVADAPDRVPFLFGGLGSSSLKGEFLFARKTLLEQHGVAAPDLVWGVAECPACSTRSTFRGENDPLTLYRVGQAMDRIKQMLVSGKQRATFRCRQCGQPLGFEHLALAAYAHYLADQDRDLHFMNERRPGSRRTFIQILSGSDCRTYALTITDQAVSQLVGRPLAMVEFWRALLPEAARGPQWRQFESGLIGLALPPQSPMKLQSFLARFQDQLAQQCPSFRPVALDLRKVPERQSKSPWLFPNWLLDQSAKVTPEGGYTLIAYVEMDRIEAVFERAAKKLGLKVQRALNGTLEARGRDLTLPVDLKPPVEEAVLRGLVPGVLAVREAGRQAKMLSTGERTLAAVRRYLGPAYTIQYNPVTTEVTIEGASGPPVSILLDSLVRDWTQDEAKTRRMLMSKVG